MIYPHKQSVITRFSKKTLYGFDRSLLFSRIIIRDVLSRMVGSDNIKLINPHILMFSKYPLSGFNVISYKEQEKFIVLSDLCWLLFYVYFNSILYSVCSSTEYCII